MTSGRVKHRSTSSTTSRKAKSPGDSWRMATKRQFGFLGSELPFPQKWDLETWRKGKRRRSNTPSSESEPMDVDFGPPFHPSNSTPTPTPTPAFAATSAEFNFISKSSRKPERSLRSTQLLNSPSDLALMRSNAFCQLRRSVRESGEGFVKGMRVYERRRSQSVATGKAKSPPRRVWTPRPIVDSAMEAATYSEEDDDDDGNNDDGDDDDVQIFAGETLATGFLSRARTPSSSGKIRHPSQRSPSTSGSSANLSDDDAFRIKTENLAAPCLSAPSLSLAPVGASSSVEITARTEKAIAALSLAMACGAGGLDDYEAFRSIQSRSPVHSEIGEMWH